MPEGNPRSEFFTNKLRSVLRGVAFRNDLPERVQTMIKDPVTGSIYVQFAQVTYLTDQGHKGPAQIQRTSIAMLQKDWTPMDNVDKLLRDYPDVSLVVDREIFEELSRNPATIKYINGDHYTLFGREGGVMQVYCEYKSDTTNFDGGSLQIFKE